MSALAIILARAGSKGVPGKNVREVGGMPCIAWTIDAARRAASVSRIVVSTDDPCARTIAMSMGVEAVERPSGLASDNATIDDAARHALNAVWAGAPPRVSPALAIDPVVLLYANVPVRPRGLIDRAVDLLVRSGADSVQSYAPVGKHHPWWTGVVDESTGHVRPWEGDVLNHGVYRRQDLPPAHIPDGGVLALRRAALMLEVAGVASGPHAFLGAERRGIVTREGEVIDIDCETDLLVADAILRRRMAHGDAA